MNVLITGAGGYIGSVVTEELIKDGYFVLALDNLKLGHRKAVSPEATFVQTDLGSADELDRVFHDYQIEGVMHLAAESTVAFSMTNPRKYFLNNVIYGVNLLDTMLKHGVSKLVFSSSAAVYGEPAEVPIGEEHPTAPVNAYGETKIMFERILHWYGRAYGLKCISLRYFNAAGATYLLGEAHNPETHLIPNVLKVALGQADNVPIFGTDYSTKDGSCVRDYIHVSDIAKAHILALKYLGVSEGNKAYNLGNSSGYSVIDVIETARKATGAQIPAVIHPRRAGDPAVLIASSKLAQSELGWQPEYPDLESIINSAWQWQKRHPYGYQE